MSKAPRPPKHLSPRAKKLWRSLMEEFSFTPDSRAILQLALENLGTGDKARALIEAEGLTTEKGTRHPACDIAKQADSLFLRCMRQLALDCINPESRDAT